MGKKKIETIVEEVMVESENISVVDETVITENVDIDHDNSLIAQETVIEDDILIEIEPELPKLIFNVGDAVIIDDGAVFLNGGKVPAELINKKCYVRMIKNHYYGIATAMRNAKILGLVAPEYVHEYIEPEVIEKQSKYFDIITLAEETLVKSRPNHNSNTLKVLGYDSLYTAIEEKDGWAHLKIGGWVELTDSIETHGLNK